MTYFEIEPAKAKTKKPDDLWDDPEWVAEEKLDGWRFLMHFGKDLRRTYMTGRRRSTLTGMLSEKGLCAEPLWPRDPWCGYTILDGEVMPPEGSGFRDIAGIMNVSPEKAAKRIEEIGPPSFHAFDILWYNGEDVRTLTQVERRQLLVRMVPSLGLDLIQVVPARRDSKAYYDEIVERGGEGIILKDIDAPYGEGWVKVKRSTTLDVIITGFTEARKGKTGKYLGQIGAAIVSVYGSNGNLIDVGQVSGMNDDIRMDMTLHPEKWICKVVEVAAQGFAKDRLRHPRFKRARPDADPRHATFQKMMRDLKEKRPESDSRQGSLF